ncbi:membrane-bound PQQ-dependent dehydrogenase, glucose/quinate/shikimate family [Methylorubrum extorquens]|jgi:quinoprotein glucose dehydrogenase|uniref:membrane-bound PQQ-dependent dehydrogenase, glucose/quinate/shikimate family n=1 Tax=Methylorubrum extorquens TaxID=408 RepID=UPI001EE5D536|nr:membrane-bound PQQ-dependent dehydrogenase, glucose/quinate/shikimate family [Methylorubrum extorquens]MCG5248116.1 membrane-bound PQQ-dependent dehydrogenase, glucose/quinate/shikimate family [Methylorubrum extorquens]
MTSINFPEPSALGLWTRRSYAALLILVGLSLLGGGVLLAVDGGSPYYLVTGLVVTASGILVWRGDRRGAWLYGAMLIGTLAWSIWEVGYAPWLLVPRLVAPFVLGLGFLLPPLRRMTPVTGPFPGWPVFAGGLVLALATGAGLHASGPGAPADPLWQTGAAVAAPGPLARPMASVPAEGWPFWGNDRGGTRYSPLNQITRQNVDKLEVAWEADTGPVPDVGKTGGLAVTPIMVGDALYACTEYNVVIALDAETGRERWRHAMTGDVASGKPCRGVSHYSVPGATGPCAERIYAASQAPDLIALDAATGEPCPGFGDGGRTSLLDGVGARNPGLYYVSSPPQVVRGKVVVGGSILDNQLWGSPSGVIRAYDAVTGRLAWAFDVGRPDRTTAPPPGETYTLSTPNSWAPASADEELGLVYMPTGNAPPDLYGGQRRAFDDAYNSAIVAIDADTGKERWRFRTMNHDLWDYDVPAQPTLIDLPTPGGLRKALILSTKRGETFVLDRVTGEAIKTVEERPVPQGGTVPGERLAPTQPFSPAMPAFRGAVMREADMWGVTPVDQMICRIKFRRMRYAGTLTPVGMDRPTLVQPGYGGGVNWGSVSVDVDRGIMVAAWMNLPIQAQLMTRAQAADRGLRIFDGKGPTPTEAPMVDTPYGAALGPFLSPLGAPCSAPPWGLMTAVDLGTGRVIWSKPFGTAYDTGPLGIRSHLPLTMGVPFSGGAITTRGGLAFIGASVEQAFRAYDVATGEEVWKVRLPAGGQATPMTYRSPKSGRQFVVIAAGGKPTLKTKQGTKIVAYALPR